MRWHRQFVWLGWKRSAFSGHAKLALHFLIIRPQVFVGNRPVRADAFSRVGPEIRRMKARRDAQPHERATPHADAGLGDNGVYTGKDAIVPHADAGLGDN